MTDTLKRHIISAAITFISAFLLSLGAQLAGGIPLEWNSTLLVALIMTALRAGTKGAVEKWAGLSGDPQ